MDLLGLTDRDGLYGAVRFVQACRRFGIGPIVGVDLALASDLTPKRRTRTPVAAESAAMRTSPRVSVLAQDGQGWAQLCRLISAAHLEGERGQPAHHLERIAGPPPTGTCGCCSAPIPTWASPSRRRRLDRAEAVVRRWARWSTPADSWSRSPISAGAARAPDP